MMNFTFLKPGRDALAVTFAVLALFPVGQVNAAPDSSSASWDKATRVSGDAGEAEVGTIPAARPGLPQNPLGAQGPVRADKQSSDSSIRDTNPLTVNGLWETKPGNLITKPSPQ